ncbi:insulinase family protein [Vibrio sp. D404a]|uniref:M16 family metallopeptidase n=1 Tax=unclassified Vibrio TaxID=2614977 RepID=UPI00255313D7|nr:MULTISPECIES: pitrilysin family protein [unclassified Vibrio]MDK9737226.1 insulinase family protein [Vibrio sp. D404a]MDK9797113.1 insulinase family protein [Vibrio sp. D449a]
MFLSRCVSICIIASSLVLACTGAFAKEIQWSSDLNHGYLDNGFQYVFHNSQNSKDPFNLRLIVNAGSVDDEHRGMAHIVEHMVFRSNRAHSIDMHRFFDQVGWKTGTQINAMTRQTETQYMVRTRPNDALDVSQSVKLLSDLAFGAKMKDQDWQLERGVILEEMRRGAGVAERVNTAKKQVVRNGSRYVDRPTIGTKKAILDVEIEDIRAFYDRYYVPGNMTLVASGYFDDHKLTEAIENTFGAEDSAPVPNRDYVKLPLKDGLVIGKVQDPKGTTSAVVYGFRSEMKPSITEAGAYQRLQNYFIRKLIKPSVRASKSEYDATISSVHISFSEPTNDRLIAAMAAKTTNHALGQQVVLTEIERLKQNGINESDLLALKEKARASVQRNRQIIPKRDFAKWEDKLTSAVMQDSVEEDYAIKSARTLKWIDELTVEGLNERLNQILSASDQFMFYQIPGGERRTLPTAEQIEQLSKKISSQQYTAIQAPAKKVTSTKRAQTSNNETELVELKAPILAKAHVMSKHKHFSPAIVQWKLANGDQVVWLDRKTPDGELYIKALSHAGYNSAAYPPWMLQAAQQVWQQTDLTMLSNQTLKRWQEEQNVMWSWAQTGSQLDLSAKVTPSRLEPLMLSYWMTQTGWTLNAEQFEQAKEAIAESVHDVSELAMERGVLWGTPQGISPTTKDVESLTQKGFSSAVEMLNQQPVSLFIVGQTTEQDIEKSILPYLAAVTRKSDFEGRESVLPTGYHTLEQAIHDEDKSTVTIKSEADMMWTPESSFLVSTLNPIVQKALKNKLRHELGGVYSIRFEMTLNKDNKVRLSTEFTTAPEKVDLLVAAHNTVLENLSQQLPLENYPRIQGDIQFAESLRLSDTNTWLRRLALSYEKYQGPDYLQSMHTLDQQVTEQRLTEIVAQIIPLPKQAILIGTPVSSEGI